MNIDSLKVFIMNEQGRRGNGQENTCCEECCDMVITPCAAGALTGCATGLISYRGGPQCMLACGAIGCAAATTATCIEQIRGRRANQQVNQNIVGNDNRPDQNNNQHNNPNNNQNINNNQNNNSHASTERESNMGGVNMGGVNINISNLNDGPSLLIVDRSHIFDPNNPSQNYGLINREEEKTEDINNNMADTNKKDSEKTKGRQNDC